ncbi:hypothetical protein [Pseudidiomarina sediminum]|uniref:hypothetical protein n=1 Tax=Pseudidiomarina sediminum TaxID=431675 RepID=UPI001C971D65|nr:hypothetical protein [Pseudidiomarina sediminum]MBY6062922.1 hypothetical protein [Pseudidiomarina sediminum]
MMIISTIAFLAGAISYHLLMKWYQSAEIENKVSELKRSHISRKFNLGSGVTFYRPYRLGKSQDGSEGKLHGISEMNIIEHDRFVELFGVWNRNGKNQIDPYSLYLPTNYPDKLIEFGQYIVEIGHRKIKQLDSA